ncbi:lipid II flippase MurJ [Paraburkholderia sediminicola]|uniref:murein biosynthesis integral membrane protein MurJ n=1 Tax=Paraburkholderia sediminicola TaxID=458836 RepID=UPI0038B958A7
MKRQILTLMGGGLVGKCAGLGRELLVASLYGTGSIASAYRLAQAGILIPINLFTADMLNAAVIPLQRHYQTTGDTDAECRFAAVVLFTFGLLGVVLGGAVYFLAEQLVYLLAPGFDTATHARAVGFLEILAVGAPLYVLSGLMSYLELGAGGHTLTSARATVQSVCLIASTCVAFVFKETSWLATGFVIAQIICCIWGWHRISALGLVRRVQMTIQQVREIGARVLALMRPLILLPILMQGNSAIERIVATKLASGAVAAIDYARLVSDTVNILITIPFALTVLSELSGKPEVEVRKHLLRILTPLALVTIPASAFLCAHATNVVTLLYGRGAFGARSIYLTSSILAAISLGMWAQAFGYVAQKALSAQLRNHTLIAFMSISLTASVLVNVMASKWLGVAAIGFAASAYGLINCVLAARAFEYTLEDLAPIGWMVLGEFGYIAIARLLTWPSGLVGLIAAGACATVFWGLWIIANERMRKSLLAFIKNRSRGETA